MTRHHPRPEPVVAGRELGRRAFVAVMALLLGALPVPAVVHAAAPLPAKITACDQPYTVIAGDYWSGIAKKVGVTLTALLAANSATASRPIFPGTVLCLPSNATPTTAGSSTTTTTTSTTVTSTTSPGTTSPSTGTTTSTSTTPGPTTPTGEPAVVVPITVFPVQGPCWYTDTWGAARSGGRRHEGVDLIARWGNYVYAAVDGTLNKQALDKPGSLGGNQWWLTGTDGTYFFYAHLAAFAPGLSIGSKVVAGQVIGFVGATGDAAGPHLHFEVHPNGGKAIDPTPTVKAMDNCRSSVPPAQPSGTLPPVPSQNSTTTTAPSGSSTTSSTTPSSGSISQPPTNTPGSSLKAPGPLWQFLSPVTVYDSNATGNRLPPARAVTVALDGISGIPRGVDGVMLRITTRGASRGGFLVAHDCAGGAPNAVSLSYTGSGTAVGTTVVSVTGGSFCVTSNQSVNAKLEVIAVRATTGVALQAAAAARVLDTRETGRAAVGSPIKLSPSALGVVTGTQALSATFTVVGPASSGSLSVGPCNGAPFTVPFGPAAVSSFSLTLRVTSVGWCVSTNVPADVVIDVTGRWAGSSGSPAPIAATRVFDSRSAGAKVGTGFVEVPVAGRGAVPAGATSVLLAISVVSGATPGIVFAMPCGGPRAVGAIAVGVPRGVTTAVVPVALTGGSVCVSALSPVDVVVDAVAAG
jgi:murein DD-endopeptidase MepM/ murein hydrolase activator NlpD